MVCLHISCSHPTLDFASCLLVTLLAKLSQAAGTCHLVGLSFRTAAKQYRPFLTTESEEVVYFSQCSLVHLWIYMFLTSSHMIYIKCMKSELHICNSLFFWGRAVCSLGIGAKGLLTCQYTFYLSIYIGPHTFSHSDDDVSSRSDDDDNDDDDS